MCVFYENDVVEKCGKTNFVMWIYKHRYVMKENVTQV